MEKPASGGQDAGASFSDTPQTLSSQASGPSAWQVQEGMGHDEFFRGSNGDGCPALVSRGPEQTGGEVKGTVKIHFCIFTLFLM